MKVWDISNTRTHHCIHFIFCSCQSKSGNNTEFFWCYDCWIVQSILIPNLHVDSKHRRAGSLQSKGELLTDVAERCLVPRFTRTVSVYLVADFSLPAELTTTRKAGLTPSSVSTRCQHVGLLGLLHVGSDIHVVRSAIYSLIHSIFLSSARSFIHAFIHSLTKSFIHALNCFMQLNSTRY